MNHLSQTDAGLRSELDEQMRFETLLLEISTHFINLPSDRIDQSIEVAQRRICGFFSIDRSIILRHLGFSDVRVHEEAWVVWSNTVDMTPLQCGSGIF